MPSQNSKITNPDAGKFIFGHVPNIPSAGIEGGPIYLSYGRHINAGTEFGFIHIWLGHQKEIIPLGYKTPNHFTLANGTALSSTCNAL